MSDAVQNIMLDILKKLQGDNAEFRRSVEDRFDRLEKRFDQLQEIVRKQRRDSAGMLVMMRATAGNFDERVSAIEERMDALEARRG